MCWVYRCGRRARFATQGTAVSNVGVSWTGAKIAAVSRSQRDLVPLSSIRRATASSHVTRAMSKSDDLTTEPTRRLLALHLASMPHGSVFALDLSGLTAPGSRD
ncbi:hypothetical protein BJS_00542 [Bradyrhizobium japonicum SEMIA 5079]|nr:hypothetical protein BJS_00542 [Bradyrhizobium japonicum SEMIA 5079]